MGNRWPSNNSIPRISPLDHAARMEVALRRYVPLLRCLPNSTLIIWLTPYHSYKGEGEAQLVKATRLMMLRAHREGVLERGLLLDTWLLSAMPGAPRSTDGNHRHPHFQTVIWSLVAATMRVWRCVRDHAVDEHDASTLPQAEPERARRRGLPGHRTCHANQRPHMETPLYQGSR